MAVAAASKRIRPSRHLKQLRRPRRGPTGALQAACVRPVRLLCVRGAFSGSKLTAAAQLSTLASSRRPRGRLMWSSGTPKCCAECACPRAAGRRAARASAADAARAGTGLARARAPRPFPTRGGCTWTPSCAPLRGRTCAAPSARRVPLAACCAGAASANPAPAPHRAPRSASCRRRSCKRCAARC